MDNAILAFWLAFSRYGIWAIIPCSPSKEKRQKQTKKPQELVWKFVEKHMKTHGTKVPWPATKKDKCCFFMIAKPFADRVTRQ